MATWLTCTSCKKAYKYLDDNNATALKKQLGDAPFVCLRCDDTVPPLSKADVIDPETGEEVRETQQYRVPTPDVVLTGADPGIMKRFRRRSIL